MTPIIVKLGAILTSGRVPIVVGIAAAACSVFLVFNPLAGAVPDRAGAVQRSVLTADARADAPTACKWLTARAAFAPRETACFS